MEIVRIRQTIIPILESQLSSAEAQINYKMHFWGLSEEAAPDSSSYETPGALDETDIPRIVSSISPSDFETLTETEKVTVGHAWEFVFGRPAPEEVKKLREDLIIRARTGATLSEQERRWYITIVVDADMF